MLFLRIFLASRVNFFLNTISFVSLCVQANVAKRISIVSVSIILIGNQVTASNVFGMLTAIMGVFYYNKVKYEENKARTTLPTTMRSDTTKSTSSILWNNAGVAEDARYVRLSTQPSQPQASNNSNGFQTYSNYQQQLAYSNGYSHGENGYNSSHFHKPGDKNQ